MTQELSSLGLPVTLGMGFISNAGAGVDFRFVPESNGTSAQYVALDIVNAVSVSVTERFSVGGSLILGTSFLDGPFVGNSSMVSDYALRGSLGAAYQLTHGTSLGVYWQTKKSFTFEDAISFAGGPFQDVQFAHPENFGLGIARGDLLDGRLLLAADVLYKKYSEADFFRAIYEDQWVLQVGSQFAPNERLRFRLGYAYAENPMRDLPASVVGGHSPTKRPVRPSPVCCDQRAPAVGRHRHPRCPSRRGCRPLCRRDVRRLGNLWDDHRDRLRLLCRPGADVAIRARLVRPSTAG